MDGLPDPVKIRRDDIESNPFFEEDYHELVKEANVLEVLIVNTGTYEENGEELYYDYIWHNDEPKVEIIEEELEVTEDVVNGDDKYIKMKKNENTTKQFSTIVNDSAVEEKQYFFGGRNFWFVVGGFFIIILVFMRALVESSTEYKNNDDSKIP